MDKCTEGWIVISFLHMSGFISIMSIVSLMIIPAYGDATGSIAVTLTYTNGDTADYTPVSLKIYQDFNKVPYKEIGSLSGNPFNIVSIDVGHKYKIEAYANGMYSGISYVDLEQPHQDIVLKLPLPGGMRANVYYNDGTTPISNATVYIKSQDNRTWSYGSTNADGKTVRFWLEPTTSENDHYAIDIKIGNDLTYSQSPVFLRAGTPQEIKITTSWPPVVNSLVTINVLDEQLHHVSALQGKFIVNLFDNNGNKIAESQVTSRGEAYFSNLKVGDYTLQAIDTNDNSEWGTSKILVDGSKLSFDLVSSPKVIAIPQPTPIPPTPAPQPVQPALNPVPKTNFTSCNCVAFRLDNVQDYWLDDVQAKIMDAFEQNNASLTIGVIGGAFGEDSKLTGLVKSKIQNGIIDAGINGWNFEDFTTFDKSQQVRLLAESKNKISKILGVSPSVFIPPYGKSDNDTFYAMVDNGIYIISGNYGDIPSSFAGKMYSYIPIGYTGLTPPPNSNQSTTNDAILSEVHKSIQSNGYAVITISFQDYAQNNGTVKINIPDNEKIQNLKSLIDDIRNNGYRIASIKDMAHPQNIPEFGPISEIALVLAFVVIIAIVPKSRLCKSS